MIRTPRVNPFTRPHPPASLDEGALVRLETLEGAPLSRMTLGSLNNVLEHRAKLGYGIKVNTGSSNNIWRLADLAGAHEEIDFNLIQGKSVVISFDTQRHRDLPTPSPDTFRVRLA